MGTLRLSQPDHSFLPRSETGQRCDRDFCGSFLGPAETFSEIINPERIRSQPARGGTYYLNQKRGPGEAHNRFPLDLRSRRDDDLNCEGESNNAVL